MNQFKLHEYENLHILLWLLKDVCWLSMSEIGGVLMAIPTLAVALHITWLKRADKGALLHNMAVSYWIGGNAVWMVGEFFYDDTLRPIAAVFFGLGVMCLAIYYLIVFPKKLKQQK